MNLLVVVTESHLFGVFTQRLKLWEVLEQIEGKKPPEALLVSQDVGRIKGAAGKRFARCTYATLCRTLKEDEMAHLHSFDTHEFRYRIFVTGTNEVCDSHFYSKPTKRKATLMWITVEQAEELGRTPLVLYARVRAKIDKTGDATFTPAELGLAPRTVRTCIAELRAKGMAKFIKPRRASAPYRMILPVADNHGASEA